MSICLRVTLHTKKYIDGTQSVRLECCHHANNRTVHRHYTICKVLPTQFDQQTRRVKNHPNESLLNALISKTYHDAETRRYTLQLHGKPVTVGTIMDFNAPLPSSQTMFLAYGRTYVERCLLKGQVHTADKYSSHLVRLSEYMGKNPDGTHKDVCLDDVTEDWILKWSVWLKNHGTKSATTMHRRMGFISTLFIDARKRGLTKADPMAFLQFKEIKIRKPKLNEDQLCQLEEASLPPGYKGRLPNARNTFLLQFYAYGSRISDALTWKKENIHQRADGMYLEYTTRKTDTHISVRLNSQAIELVNHYLQTVPGPFLLPWLSRFRPNPKWTEHEYEARLLDEIGSKTALVNGSLKVISEKVGLPFRLTTHIARHSFATLADSRIADKRLISAALGHSNYSTTEIYLSELQQSRVCDAMDSVWRKPQPQLL